MHYSILNKQTDRPTDGMNCAKRTCETRDVAHCSGGGAQSGAVHRSRDSEDGPKPLARDIQSPVSGRLQYPIPKPLVITIPRSSSVRHIAIHIARTTPTPPCCCPWWPELAAGSGAAVGSPPPCRLSRGQVLPSSKLPRRRHRICLCLSLVPGAKSLAFFYPSSRREV